MPDFTTTQSALTARQSKTFDAELLVRDVGEAAVTGVTSVPSAWIPLGTSGATYSLVIDTSALTGDCQFDVVHDAAGDGVDSADGASVVVTETGRVTLPFTAFTSESSAANGGTSRPYAKIRVTPTTSVTFSAYIAKATDTGVT